MSDSTTLRVGSQELRKTAEGWQYLSEGVQGEPDRWCDATSSLGPFSNAGVNNLLDELLAAHTHAAEAATRVCKNCRHWDSEGNCDFIDTIQGERVADTTGCQIIATVHDDSGLYTELKTGPNFSCPNFASVPAPDSSAVSFR